MPRKSTEAQASEEARGRAQAEKPADQVPEEERAPQGAAQDRAEADGGPEEGPTEVFQVKVNPKFTGKSVTIDGKIFYKDTTLNASQGTMFLNDQEFDSISKVKEPEGGFQYIVKGGA